MMVWIGVMGLAVVMSVGLIAGLSETHEDEEDGYWEDVDLDE